MATLIFLQTFSCRGQGQDERYTNIENGIAGRPFDPRVADQPGLLYQEIL